MKIIAVLLGLVALSIAQVDFSNWHSPVAGELRGPCPGLNSLANHGILPRDGKNLTVPVVVKALSEALNVSAEIGTILALGALKTSSDPASATFNLNDLDKHNIIEHDGSLSRKDTNLGGEKQEFCPEIFGEFLSYFNGSKEITLQLAAAARWGRIQTERKRDPKFTYSPSNRFSSYAESAVYNLVLRDPKTGTVPLDFINVLFSQERLPFKEGWRPATPVNGFSVADTILQLAINTPEDPSDIVVKGDRSHTGILETVL